MLRRNHLKIESLKYAYGWIIKWTYIQKTHVRVSFRCEIYESQMILNLCTNEWFQLFACKRLLINVINSELQEQLTFLKNLQ